MPLKSFKTTDKLFFFNFLRTLCHLNFLKGLILEQLKKTNVVARLADCLPLRLWSHAQPNLTLEHTKITRRVM